MSDQAYIEPFAIQETYAEDGAFELRDGNVIITYLRKIGGEIIAVHRAIIPLKRFIDMRTKATMVLTNREPTKIMAIIKAPIGKTLS